MDDLRISFADWLYVRDKVAELGTVGSRDADRLMSANVIDVKGILVEAGRWDYTDADTVEVPGNILGQESRRNDREADLRRAWAVYRNAYEFAHDQWLGDEPQWLFVAGYEVAEK